MDVGKECFEPSKDDQLAEQIGRTTLNDETKEEFMAKLRSLAERIDVGELFAVSYVPQTDAEHTLYSAFNNNVASNTWGPAEVNDEKFSDAFGSAYDAHHVSPIIVSELC